MKISIIGNGSFGAFAAKALSPYADIYTYDKNPDDNTLNLQDITSMDAVLLAIPLSAYQDVLGQLKPILKKETLVIDICSVKVPSRDLVLGTLESHPNILVSHPLFGPQSAASGLAGHDIIITNVIGEQANKAVTFLKEKLHLNTHLMTAEEHDRMMAYVHALTFFIARGLSDLEIPSIPLKTPSFAMLQALIDLDRKHSDELFMTIQRGNPYAADVRKAMIEELNRLDHSI